MPHPLQSSAALFRFFAVVFAWVAVATAGPAMANNIDTELVVEGPVAPGETVTLAIAQSPHPGWHGYWSNPGDAGFGMSLDWSLPEGFTAGEPQYPVPQPLLIGPLMNHVYEGPYAVLVPFTVPDSAAPGDSVTIQLAANWLACTDEICVPERGQFTVQVAIAPAGTAPAENAQFTAWRAALPAPVLAKGTYAISGKRLRMAIPLAAAAPVTTPHVFPDRDGVAAYAAPQAFSRNGDWLVVETEAAPDAVAEGPAGVVLRLGDEEQGLAVTLEPGAVPAAGTPIANANGETNGVGEHIGWLVLAAFLGGVILNVMPCVFPILSLKALSLARANTEGAHVEALAYTGGVLVAVLALGAALLGLRAAGQEVGWAFQLQEPATVVLLLILAAAITANLAGLYEMILPVRIERHSGGAFMTGVLAAFIATPCTGPFMAAAMGAALLLPVFDAMLLFAALGIGLAFPFLLIGFVPPLRRALPAPGPWMVRFRHVMALPMGLTALALGWLAWRTGGERLLLLGLVATVLVVALLVVAGRRQQRGHSAAAPILVALGLALVVGGVSAAMDTPAPRHEDELGALAFSDEALAQARSSGKPVFAYFTADWCVTCKINEAAAINRDATGEAFAKAGVVVLRGDWTRRDPVITRYLEAQGAAGVPLYVWYDPGKDGMVLPQILTGDLLVERARSAASAR